MILLAGGGGHCKSVLDSLQLSGRYTRIGIVDRPGSLSNEVDGIPVTGSDEDLPRLFHDGWQYAFVTLGSVGYYKRREQLYRLLLKVGFTVPVICDDSACVSRNAELGKGSFAGKRALINAGTIVGDCAIVNTGAILEHDCSVGDFAHISTGAVLCGGVSVGKGTHIGAGAVVRQGIAVGANSIIGIGSVVIRDIPDHVVAYGNPCKVVREL